MVVEVHFSEPRFEEPEPELLDNTPVTLLAGFPFNNTLCQRLTRD